MGGHRLGFCNLATLDSIDWSRVDSWLKLRLSCFLSVWGPQRMGIWNWALQIVGHEQDGPWTLLKLNTGEIDLDLYSSKAMISPQYFLRFVWNGVILKKLYTHTHTLSIYICMCVCLYLYQGFLISVLLSFGTRQFFVVEGFPVHSKVFSSIPGLRPLSVSSRPPSWDNQIYLSRHSQTSPEDKPLTYVCVYVCMYLIYLFILNQLDSESISWSQNIVD